ncbi:MAG: glycoside hydrolase family 88 protein [Bacteroidaceae bacterium]|nr:glycoside hydrolase family 88 protein [Bacteroidaceae bacterium]
MSGPYEVVARDGEFRASKGGSERDMWTAWQCAQQGYSDKALEIINAYAATLQRFDGHDAPLCAIQGYWLVRAMTILKNSQFIIHNSQLESWGAMIRRAMLPMIDKFEADSPYANGNWGAIVNRLRMACGIFLEDSTVYQASIDYFLHANDNGSLPKYISEMGQCQETGRDQGHAQLGLGALCETCEMAWEQGDDLWGSLDNRMLKGIEYSARYNLGYDVPFETWTDCTGLYNDWTEPGSMGRGRIRCIYDLPYNHFVKRKGLKMPYTKKLLELQAKAEKRGEIQQNPEANQFTVKGVQEGTRLHQVFTYPAPEGAPLKHDYDVFVQPRGSKEWTRVDTYMAKVNSSPTPDPSRNGGEPGGGKHQVSEISYCVFDFTGDVFVKVICKNRKFQTVRIRPDYRGTIANVQNDSTVQFLLFQPENVSVEFDGDITNNLLVFTSKPSVSKEEAEREAKAQGRAFKYYAPGYYNQQDTIYIDSNTTVYLEDGSYFTSTFAINDAENVSILGRGIARPERGYEGAHVHRSKNVLIDGLVLNTCPIGESHNVTLHDVRSISHPSWGDGLNVFGGCSDILFDRVFCRNSDDCTTAYATRKDFSGSTRNITMRNSTLWADVAHPIFIGLHGNSERSDTIENLRYENIDILGQTEPQVDYQGCLAINCGDNNLVRNVVFDNIRIEQIEQGCITQVKVGYNQKYCTAPGRGVEEITFRNIRYYGKPPYISVINGYNEDRMVRNITFESLKMNGKLIHDKMKGKPAWYSSADYVPIYVGNHVKNVVFSKDSRNTLVSQSLTYCSSQVDRALEALRPYDFTMMPRNILQGETLWNLRKAKPQEWCSGFWPGILWMTFSYNKSEAVHKAATGYTDALIPVVEAPVYDHDLGFITINSFLKGYEVSKDSRYREMALRAADSLATLFNPTVGTILSWPRHVKDYDGHNTIMDNMMNLELLFWAGRDSIAVRHAETTMKNHFRQDGSCYHVAVYDTLDGHFIKGVTHQGYADNSMWSRGQSWAIYGYTMVYRYTRNQRFLDFAQKVTDIYLKRLRETSDDWVPYWDMDDPEILEVKSEKVKREKLKDASAACVVASALLELCQYVGGEKATAYRDAAINMLCDLSTDRYRSRDKNVSFLLHSTGHHPAGSEIDASIIYADYYYLEALLRLKDI